jgi:hypothetical protein
VDAADLTLHNRAWFHFRSVYRRFCAERTCQAEFVVGNIDRDAVHAHRPRILHRDVAEPADAGDGDPFSGLHLGFLQPLVGRHARAQHRGGAEFKFVGQISDEARIGQQIFGQRVVDRVAGVLLPATQRLPAGCAIGAGATGGVQPRHADAVAFADHAVALAHLARSGADGRHDACSLMARDEKRSRVA